MELIFIFTISLFQIFRRNFLELVKIIRTFGIDTFVDAEEFTVFLSYKSFATVRAY